MGHIGAPSLSLASPLLPAQPPLLRRDKCGERTVYVSPDCPKAMERANGQWWVGGAGLAAAAVQRCQCCGSNSGS